MRRHETVTTTLLGGLRNREETAYNKLYFLFDETLHLRFIRLGVAESDVQDLKQQVFTRVVESLSTFTPDGQKSSFRRWLMTIARNLAMDYHRRCHPDRLNTDHLRGLPDAGHGKHSEEVAAEVYRMLSLIERDFEPATFDAFVRFWIHGEDTDSIARTQKKSTSAIREGRRRVLRRLREDFLDVYGESEWPLK